MKMHSGCPQKINLKRVAALTWLTGVILIVLGSNTLSRAESKTPAIIVPYDSITYPGIEVWPQAKVVVKRFYGSEQSVGGERIEFLEEGKYLGLALTGGDGDGVIRYIPYGEGIRRIRIRLYHTSGYKSEEAEMFVGVWSRSRPIILVSVDALKERQKEVVFPFMGKLSKETDWKPAAFAVDVLSDMSKRFNIVYLYNGNLTDFQKMRSWLSTNKFPLFPMIIRNDNINYIKRLISDRGKEIKGVVLNIEEEVDLFQNKQLRMFRISWKKEKSKNKDEFKNISIVTDWREIRKGLF